LRVYDGEKLLAAHDVTLTSDVGITTQSIAVPAGDPGVRDLRFTVDPLPGERNTINNSRTHVMDVTPQRRNVLYVEGEPRWEYKFIRRAAETDTSLRLASIVRATPNRYYRQGIEKPEELSSGFPKKTEELFAYDAVVIGSFEATALTPEQHEALKNFVDRWRRPCLPSWRQRIPRASRSSPARRCSPNTARNRPSRASTTTPRRT
jgi:hypothetical protein